MRIELYCPNCQVSFAAPPEMSAHEAVERMAVEGAPYALGDGETFEDMIFGTLTEEGEIPCPECNHPVVVSEESLGQLAKELLAEW